MSLRADHEKGGNEEAFKNEISASIDSLKAQEMKLKTHLEHISRPEYTDLRNELKQTLKEQLYRNTYIQGLGLKSIEQYEDAIIMLNKTVDYAADKRSQGYAYYNMACYYSLLNQTGSAMRFLDKAIEAAPDLAKDVVSESDFNNLKQDDNLSNNA